MSFFRNLFSREPSSAQLAKQRLQVVLVQDHIPMPPGTMEAIKAEIMEVISRHLEIEPEGVEVAVERRGHNDEVVANIPVRRNYGRTRNGEAIPLARPAAPPPRPPRPVTASAVGRAAGRRH
jgi:cell division topological specificity factor